MGIYDSSRTRVAPVFGRLQCLDPSGRLWLQGLLELANTRKGPRPQAGTSRLRVAKWWPREARLAAPPGLLQWLLEHAEEPHNPKAWGRRPEVVANRRRIVDRDADTLAAALKSLQARRASPRAWYVLEGPSQPDVYLASDDVVIVVEGKRTEAAPATSTDWMRVRHQMLRHLDGAWEHRQGRQIYGLFIVEAEQGTSSVRFPLDDDDHIVGSQIDVRLTWPFEHVPSARRGAACLKTLQRRRRGLSEPRSTIRRRLATIQVSRPTPSVLRGSSRMLQRAVVAVPGGARHPLPSATSSGLADATCRPAALAPFECSPARGALEAKEYQM